MWENPTTDTPVIEEHERFDLPVGWIASLLEQNGEMKARIFPPEISVGIAVWQILRQSSPCLSCSIAALSLGFAAAVGNVDPVGKSLDVIAHGGIPFRSSAECDRACSRKTTSMSMSTIHNNMPDHRLYQAHDMLGLSVISAYGHDATWESVVRSSG